jgi:signal transduction histidine kinase/DNA-binding response OmpR family regulator
MVDEVASREGQLLQERMELDRRVRERTDDLRTALDELRVAKEATDQAMKQQEIFLANVAHDLRSPLAVVLGFSEDLLRRARRTKQEAFIPDLQLIVNRGKDLLELINDLLNLSRSMGEKGIALDIEEFDVVAMLQDRMEGIGTIAKKNRNVIEFQPAEGGVGCMTADKGKVWRILMNLLSNACKFTRNGTVTLTVERESVGNQHQIIFRVRDTGVGISPEDQKFLFQRFVQTSSSSGRLASGFGLGLSICMLYCRAMGGTISVESEPGKGSIFTVSLPAKVSAAHSEAPIAGPPAVQPAPQPASVETPAAESPTPAKGQDAGLVLVVDDDASIGDLIRRNLVEEGFRTQTALDGEEGIRLAKQLVPSAIVLDIVMPGIDGWGVLAALRADARTAGIPIIVASIIEEKERGLNLGAQDYVTKPLSRERLSRFLHQHLDRGPPARILVVENDPEKQDRLSTMLREQGWEVLTAPDGGDALRRLSLGTPDLILLDVMIPSINGRQLIAEIRNNPDCESIPILVLTAEGASAEDLDPIKEQVGQIMSLGAHDRDELFREIRYLVAVRRRVSTPTTEAGHG